MNDAPTPEKASGDNDASAQWEALKNTSFAGAPNTGKTVASVAENAVERKKVQVDNFIAGWQKKRAEKGQSKASETLERDRETYESAELSYWDSFLDNEDAAAQKKSADGNVDQVRSGIGGNRERISTLRSETRLGGHIKTQAEQVGAILKAGSEVVKSGLKSLRADIVSRLPILPKISELSARAVVERAEKHISFDDARSERAATRVNNLKQSEENLAVSRENLRNSFNKLGKNRQERREKRAELKNERADLRFNIESLRTAQREQSEANRAYDVAQKDLASAERQLDQAREQLDRSELAKNQASQKVEDLNAKIARQEAMLAFQEKLGGQSPAKLRQAIEEEKKKTIEEEEKMLLMRDFASETGVSESLQRRLTKQVEGYEARIATFDAQLDALDSYQETRKGQENRIVAHPTLRSFLRSSRAA